MKLEVHRNGTKLFFITFAVKGRWPILSRLVDEKSRPEDYAHAGGRCQGICTFNGRS